MSLREYFAHSPISTEHQPQGYREHIFGVERLALARLNIAMSDYCKPDPQFGEKLKYETARAIIKLSAYCHDIGKLVSQNQIALANIRTEERLPFSHDEISSALMPEILCPKLTARNSQRSQRTSFPLPFLKAIKLVAAHHRGLFDEGALDINNGSLEDNFLYFLGEASKALHNCDKKELADIVKPHRARVKRILKEWNKLVCKTSLKMGENDNTLVIKELERFLSPMTMRILLACLAWGDYRDTGEYYHASYACQKKDVALLPLERLAPLAGAEEIKTSERGIYYFSASDILRLKYMLKSSAEHNLRRLFVITSSADIHQKASLYRRLLTLQGEDPEEAISVAQGNMDFYKRENRRLISDWEAPVVLVSDTAFFDSLVQNAPYALTKLPNLTRSAIIFDSDSKPPPSVFRGVTYKWLCELVERWGCNILFASKTTCKLWEHEALTGGVLSVKAKDVSEDIEDAEPAECGRVKKDLDVKELEDMLVSMPGPRLLVLNTTYAAAGIAAHFRRRFGSDKAEHLSDALLPDDIQETVARIVQRLANNDYDWTLVTTTASITGLDFSFFSVLKETNSESWESAEPLCSFKLYYAGVYKDLVAPASIDKKKDVITEQKLLEYDDYDMPKFRSIKKEFNITKEHHCRILLSTDPLVKALRDDKEKVCPAGLQKYSLPISESLALEYNCPVLIDEGRNSVYLWNRSYDKFIGYYAGVFDSIILKTC